MEHHPHAIPLAHMLVSVDALFDTRLGTIGKMGVDLYAKVIASNYGGRNSDHFPDVPADIYRKLYNERDAVTLSLSMTTHVVSLIKDFCARVNIASATSPVKAHPKVDVNFWPYQMPDKIAKQICEALALVIQEPAEIDFVNYSPEDLHYDVVKHTYDHLVFYNIGEWLSAQAEDWEKGNRAFSSATVFFPMLHWAEKAEDVPEDITGIADETNRRLAALFNPMQLPIQFFCSAFNATAIAMAPEAEAPSATTS